MVTKEHLQRLRAERSQPKPTLDYTIGGAIHSQVTANLDMERELEIKLGERAMRDALRDMRREHALSRHHGQAKAIFNHKQEIKP